MFGDLDSRMQRFRAVVRQNRDLALGDDVAAIDARIHVMDGATGDFFSRK